MVALLWPVVQVRSDCLLFEILDVETECWQRHQAMQPKQHTKVFIYVSLFLLFEFRT